MSAKASYGTGLLAVYITREHLKALLNGHIQNVDLFMGDALLAPTGVAIGLSLTARSAIDELHSRERKLYAEGPGDHHNKRPPSKVRRARRLKHGTAE